MLFRRLLPPAMAIQAAGWIEIPSVCSLRSRHLSNLHTRPLHSWPFLVHCHAHRLRILASLRRMGIVPSVNSKVTPTKPRREHFETSEKVSSLQVDSGRACLKQLDGRHGALPRPSLTDPLPNRLTPPTNQHYVEQPFATAALWCPARLGQAQSVWFLWFV